MIERSIAILTLILSTGYAVAQDKAIVSTVYLKEKQNKPAAAVPANLLEAYSNGDIKAFYPRNPNIEVPYIQFLNHFGMADKAQKIIASAAPTWFCLDRKTQPVDSYVIDCMQHKFELVEKVYRNNITYQQERKMMYVKTIFSSECAIDGLEKEGPIFKVKDIAKLREYRIVNHQNPAITYSVEEFLKLRLYNAR